MFSFSCYLVSLCAVLVCVEASIAPQHLYLNSEASGKGEPLVVVENVLPDTLLNELLKHGEASLIQQSFSGASERWTPIGTQPVDLLEQAVLEIAAVDLEHILSPNLAKKVGGIAWRLNAALSDTPYAWHFDCDEGTSYAEPGVRLIHPLLSTVTYLSNSGGPTVLLNFTVPDFQHVSTHPPRSGFVSMPQVNKHVAFDPRLLHGVVPQMAFEQNGARIVLGMNFWEVQTMETMMQQHSQRMLLGPPLFSKDMLRVESPRVLPWGASADHDNGRLRITRLQPLGNERHCSHALETPVWVDEHADDEDAKWNRNAQLTHQVQQMRMISGQQLQLFLRFPSGKFLELESASRGHTIHFNLGCEDVMLQDNREQFDDDFSAFKNRESYRLWQARSIAQEMLTTRCSLFEPTEESMNPADAALYCKTLSSKGAWSNLLDTLRSFSARLQEL
eukprot:TRINITY_DN23946_c0_g1_i1.p1 TRINITY_DN23946_c0_g1~~TRINITY_DN23946_c0_g1_i1.p1  ORF type:complete len:447 (+),score=42.35 TRINITY_DN23946_c0_g1_i1:91-1431(+)